MKLRTASVTAKHLQGSLNLESQSQYSRVEDGHISWSPQSMHPLVVQWLDLCLSSELTTGAIVSESCATCMWLHPFNLILCNPVSTTALAVLVQSEGRPTSVHLLMMNQPAEVALKLPQSRRANVSKGHVEPTASSPLQVGTW